MASYRKAVEWIALNDAPGDYTALSFTDSSECEHMILEVETLISVCLIADVWNKSTSEVAEAVISYRRKNGIHS